MSHLNQFIKQCHDNLLNSKASEVSIARDYLVKRNIKDSSLLLHDIGYCNYKDQIPKEIAFYGKEEKDIDINGKGGYSYFIRGKVIVPIYSEFGLIVGFATRKPSFEAGNTWWNLSKPFHKSNHLYLLDKARKNIFDSNKIYLVEGYIDAILLNQEGLKNVVCLMGTNLSPRQVGLLARYCSNICLCLDVDKNNAGQKAQGKSIYSLKRFDFHESISVVDGLPVGEDPDVFVTKNGLPELLKLERTLSDSEVNKIYRDILAQSKWKS
jgi:DNA primase